MSAPSHRDLPAGIEVRELELEIIEVAALHGGAAAAPAFGAGCGEPLPDFGHVTSAAPYTALCVRPSRWLLLDSRAALPPGARAARWRAGAAHTVVTELSSALRAFTLSGAEVREMLARGCRLDLHPQAFPAGTAAATVMAQVPVILAALPRALLLLTPSSTGQHFRAWLETTSSPFGLRALQPAAGSQGLSSGETVETHL